MSTTDAWTIGRLLTWTTEYLKNNDAHSPRLDAEVLLAHARDCERIELYAAFGEEPTEEVKAAFKEMVRRRAEGTPVAYLVGHKEFYAATFEVNPDVLIPRPETEHLIVEAVDRARELLCRKQNNANPPRLRIADVGTGSGIIAITIAKQIPEAFLTAIDISAAALNVARRNAERQQLGPDRIEFIESDVFDQVPTAELFDLILSNPPYVSAAEYDKLHRTVKDFEPKLALLAEDGGAAIIARLAAESETRVAPEGSLIFEFSPMLADRASEFAGSFWHQAKITKDLAGLARIVTLQPSQNKTEHP